MADSTAVEVAVCVDFGSTFTKAALVDLAEGRLLATAEHPTTSATDVLEGWRACRARLASADPRAADAEVLACSSAGGGLRIAVVGNEQLVTAEAGRRVALSSGGRVVHVSAGALDEHGVETLRRSRPDVVLLVGGTDGGNSEVLLACTDALAAARWPGPVVVAGNVAAQAEVAARLDASATPHVLADNVLPRIGVLAPGSARAAVRRMFLEHVIGGKHLSASHEFTGMVRAATPDAVLTAVELLSRGLGEGRPGAGDVLVVDVGGATTDVYSAVEPVEERAGDGGGLGVSGAATAGLSREVVAPAPVTRTVEGDLGLRWSAPSTVEEGYAAGFLSEVDLPAARAAAERRHADPAYLPVGEAEAAEDRRLAALALGVAVRRHAGRAQVRYEAGEGGAGRWVERSGTDLREVGLLVGSGGVLRHTAGEPAWLLEHLVEEGGWQVPERPRCVVDRDYVLAPAGLLAADHPVAAYRLLQMLT